MIGDQLQRDIEAARKVPVRYQDPDEPLAGKCLTCSKVVGCLRRDAVVETGAFSSKQSASGVWSDIPSTECPECKARVFVMPLTEFRRVAKMA